MNAPARQSARWLAALAFVSLLPNLGAALPRGAYYFRDFSLTFYPQRFYFASEVAQGRWPFWNPYLYEGSAVLPFYFPVDFLHLLWPSPVFVSWLLTLHIPFASVAMFLLARDLGATRGGAFVAGALYAAGGLALSSLSLFIFLEALAWAPLVVLLLRRAALTGERFVPLAALALAVSLSTLAVEFAAQAALLGALLAVAARPSWKGVLRVGAAGALGVVLAGLPVLLMSGIMSESLRSGGLTPFEALQRSVHPLSLLQVIVSDALGKPSEPFQLRFWSRLFADGAPYFTTYYLGPVALVLAAAGVAAPRRRARVVLLGLLLLALAYALGRHAGLAPLLAPHLRFFRFPVKALLTPYLLATLLAGLGAARLAAGEGRRASLAAALLIAAATGALGLLLTTRTEEVQAFLAIDDALAGLALPLVARSAFVSAGLGLAAAGLCAGTRVGLLAAPRAAALLAALAIADVARAGVGVNPQAPSSFYALLPEIRHELEGLGDQRVFAYGTQGSPAINELLGTRRAGLHLQTFFLARQALSPFTNLLDRLPTAEGLDRHGFIPNPPLLKRPDYDPTAVGRILPALRSASVGRVVTLDEPSDPALRLRARVASGLPGRTIQVYELKETWPRAFVGCEVRVEPDRAAAQRLALSPDVDPARTVVLEAPGRTTCHGGRVLERSELPGVERYVVDLDGEGYLVSRGSFTPSWSAQVDGRPSRVLRANGRHRAVAVAAGRHEVRLRYEPPLLRAGLLVSALGALLVGWLLVRPSGSTP
ncbi:MAG TPA: hypothetical protein VFM88_01945 [Vicinamibacteria bacterium]|nr:hypothetical protein [Vicinamibacteria bacterium]